MHTRNQLYAAKTYEQIEADVVGKGEEYKKSYGAMAHKLPVLIRTAGLMQALAFVQSRGKPEHKKLLDHLAVALKQPDGNALQIRAQKAELAEYMKLTNDALASLLWYKRFAQSILKVESDEDINLEDTTNNAARIDEVK